MAKLNDKIKENDIVVYNVDDPLVEERPELKDQIGIVRDAFNNTLYVEFFCKGGKSLDIKAVRANAVTRKGSLYNLVWLGMNLPMVASGKVAAVPRIKKERKPRAPKAEKAPKELKVVDNRDKELDIVEARKLDNNLKGLRILPTGLFDRFSRASMVECIENHGGIYGSGGVNKKLDILVVGRAAGPAKIAKAKELGIKMIDEMTFLNMIQGN